MESKFTLLTALPTEATYKPSKSGEASVDEVTKETRDSFYNLAKEITALASGEGPKPPPRPQSPPKSPTKKTSPVHRKKGKAKAKTMAKEETKKIKKPHGVSQSEFEILKKKAEYRNSLKARKALEKRAKAYKKKINVGKAHVLRNKANTGNPEFHHQRFLDDYHREQERRAQAVVRKAQVEQEHLDKLADLTKTVAIKMDPDHVPKRLRDRFQRTWLTIIAATTRVLCAGDSLTAAQCPWDFREHLTDQEKKSDKPLWLARRRVIRTRDALGSLWRCLVAQRMLDRFKKHILDENEKANKQAQDENEMPEFSDSSEDDEDED